jgi:hypothetical protein
VLGEPADRASLPGRIASFNQNRDPFSVALNPPLEPDQFNLQLPQLLLIQQPLTHFLDINGFVLEQLNEALSRIDPSEIILGQGAARFADTS